jgi:acetylcholinesterase/cholinesterase
MSVAALLQSRVSQEKKNFHAAIIQSDPFGVLFRTPQQQANHTRNFVNLLGCSFGGEQCVRSAPIKAILDVQLLGITLQWPLDWQYVILQLPWVPTIDGNIVPGNPVATFAKGDILKVPVIMGTVKNETLDFGWELQIGLRFNFTSVEYYGLLGVLFGWNAGKIFDKYPRTYFAGV